MFFDSSQFCWNIKMYHKLYLLMKDNDFGFNNVVAIIFDHTMFKMSYPKKCIFVKVGITFYFNLDNIVLRQPFHSNYFYSC